MIPFEQALKIVSDSAISPPAERTGLADCLGRVLAEDVYSDMDMPPFDKSAVDGYACRFADLSLDLKLLEVIPAGKPPRYPVGEGECSKLMTGGMLPSGADTVIMIEDVDIMESGAIRFRKETSSGNICYQAEDIHRADLVLHRSTLIRPQEVAVLASVGAANPLVFSKIKIGIITTGDELVEPHQTPGISQIRNSNAWQLIAQVIKAGCLPAYYGIAVDDMNATRDLIEKAVSENDIVVLTGGISVGDFDFVPAVLESAGFDLKFRSLAVQPGKPSIFATRAGKYLFALPGNPVSGFVQFELMVRHLINTMTGCFDSEKTIRLPLGMDYRRRRTDRKAFVPVTVTEEGMVVPVDYHGSAHIHSYIHALGVISVELGVNQISKGTLLDVRFL